MMGRVRLPRASSKAYRQLKQQQQQRKEEAKQAQQDAAEAGAAEAEQPLPTEAEQPPPQAAEGDQKLVAALNEVKASDAGAVLEAGAGGGTLRCGLRPVNRRDLGCSRAVQLRSLRLSSCPNSSP